MALTRARVVAGEVSLAADVAETVRRTLTRPRNAEKVAHDARTMRALIASEKGDRDVWDLKLVAGGLIDIEFVAQYLCLAHGASRPEILDASTRAVLDKAGRAGLITPDQAETLIEAHRLYTDATQFMRLSISGRFDPTTAGAGVKRRIATATGFPDFEAFTAALAEARKKARAAFEAILAR
jgi:glutamate-ammonia-ligase adenylyltransferase